MTVRLSGVVSYSRIYYYIVMIVYAYTYIIMFNSFPFSKNAFNFEG